MSRAETLVPLEEYLHSAYDPDCDYIDGRLEERNLGEIDHSRLQMAIAAFFYNRRAEWSIEVFPEVRVQVAPERFRVPDVCVVKGRPQGRILTAPPWIVIEILSPEDTLTRLMERIEDYLRFGVQNVWVIDPGSRRAWRASSQGLETASSLRAEGEPAVVLELDGIEEWK